MKNTDSKVSKSDVICKLFIGASKQGISYCILRNYHGLPESTQGGDIDLLIYPNDKQEWINHLLSVSSLYGLSLGVIQSHYHGDRYCIYNINMLFFLKLDVHYGEYWRGVQYLAADQLMSDSKIYNKLNIPSAVNEALLSLLDPLVTGGTAGKYFKFISKTIIANRSEFTKCLGDIVGFRYSERNYLLY